MSTIDEKIKIFKTSKEEYNKHHRELIHLGFNKGQAAIIVNRGLFQVPKTIKEMIGFLKESSEFLLQYFSREHLTTVIDNESSLSKLIVLKRYTNDLIAYGFTAEDIVCIISHEKGEKTIADIVVHFSQLHNNLKFSHKSIVDIANNRNGSANLLAVLNLAHLLLENGFSTKQISRLASRNGGSKTMRTIVNHIDWLIRYFEPKEIVKIANRAAGSKKIETVKEHFESLREMGYSKKNIVDIAAHNLGDTRVLSILNITSIMTKLGIRYENIVLMLDHKMHQSIFTAIASKFNSLTKDHSEKEILTQFKRNLGLVDLTKKRSASDILKQLDALYEKLHPAYEVEQEFTNEDPICPKSNKRMRLKPTVIIYRTQTPGASRIPQSSYYASAPHSLRAPNQADLTHSRPPQVVHGSSRLEPSPQSMIPGMNAQPGFINPSMDSTYRTLPHADSRMHPPSFTQQAAYYAPAPLGLQAPSHAGLMGSRPTHLVHGGLISEPSPQSMMQGMNAQPGFISPSMESTYNMPPHVDSGRHLHTFTQPAAYYAPGPHSMHTPSQTGLMSSRPTYIVYGGSRYETSPQSMMQGMNAQPVFISPSMNSTYSMLPHMDSRMHPQTFTQPAAYYAPTPHSLHAPSQAALTGSRLPHVIQSGPSYESSQPYVMPDVNQQPGLRSSLADKALRRNDSDEKSSPDAPNEAITNTSSVSKPALRSVPNGVRPKTTKPLKGGDRGTTVSTAKARRSDSEIPSSDFASNAESTGHADGLDRRRAPSEERLPFSEAFGGFDSPLRNKSLYQANRFEWEGDLTTSALLDTPPRRSHSNTSGIIDSPYRSQSSHQADRLGRDVDLNTPTLFDTPPRRRNSESSNFFDSPSRHQSLSQAETLGPDSDSYLPISLNTPPRRSYSESPMRHFASTTDSIVNTDELKQLRAPSEECLDLLGASDLFGEPFSDESHDEKNDRNMSEGSSEDTEASDTRLLLVVKMTSLFQKLGIQCENIASMLKYKKNNSLFIAIENYYSVLLTSSTEKQIKTDFWRFLSPQVDKHNLTALNVLDNLDTLYELKHASQASSPQSQDGNGNILINSAEYLIEKSQRLKSSSRQEQAHEAIADGLNRHGVFANRMSDEPNPNPTDNDFDMDKSQASQNKK